jgi:hypothetical protein
MADIYDYIDVGADEINEEDVIVFGNDDHEPFPPEPSGGGTDLDSLNSSTNVMADNDLVVTKENGATDWVKKSASKVWDYIKGKIGISTTGSTYLKKNGTWGSPSEDLHWKGTIAEYNQLSSSEKAKYTFFHILDAEVLPDLSQVIARSEITGTLTVGAQASVAFPTLTVSKSGWTPIWAQIQPRGYGDYVTVNAGTTSLSSGQAKITGAYAGNWKSGSISLTYAVVVLWYKEVL